MTDHDLLVKDLVGAMAGMERAERVVNDATIELHIAVAACREAGWSWAEVAKALGTSRQAAWERFAKHAGIP